ncbi:hypothetical protein BTO32_15155 [Marinobacter lutaoensis]|uniref:KfrA N-terminal DNA-binding domain-containing protein n=1 Tax=Marinobacter lutaoensis TaxID=135739 RepID=A0A1V2DPI4_9GAMM|nr:DNA-binding protein [Marinobacter lutaoensis]ONF42544.1 hypothetical protein BTO32_15155 [Marinobacter lutaoensis]
MARPPAITYEDVARACVRIISNRKYASVDAIYEEVGRRGSKSTILKHQKRFFDDFKNKGLTTLPSSIPEEIVPIIEDFWNQALQKAGERFNELEKGWEKEVAEATQTIAQQSDRIAQLERELDDRKKALAEQYQKRATTEDALDAATRTISKHELTIHAQQQEIQSLNQRINALQDDHAIRLDAMRKEHAEQLKALKDALDEVTERSKRDEEKQVRMVDYWMLQVDHARTQMSELKSQMREEKERYAADLKIERTKVIRLSQDLDDATTANQNLKTKIAALEQRVDELETLLDSREQ